MKMNIRAIIFDFGGVISTNDDLTDIGRFLAKKYNVNPKILDEITLRGWMKARVNPKHDNVFWREVAKALGISEIQLHDEYLEFPQLIPETVEIVKRLRKQYIVGMLSNQISSWHKTLMKLWKLEKHFDPIVTSYGEGVAKPDPKIYKRLIKKIGVAPTECLFIDDREYNLEPARALGIQTILFKTPKQLIRDLKKFGVRV